MDLAEAAAREAIRDLVARYNAAGDAGRFEPMLELFCEDAVLELEGRVLRGRQQIRGLFEEAAQGTGAPGGTRFIRHFTSSHQIDLEGRDRASGRLYYQVLTEAGLDHWGRYVDRYRLDGASWRFAHRKVTIDAALPGGWAASRQP